MSKALWDLAALGAATPPPRVTVHLVYTSTAPPPADSAPPAPAVGRASRAVKEEGKVGGGGTGAAALGNYASPIRVNVPTEASKEEILRIAAKALDVKPVRILKLPGGQEVLSGKDLNPGDMLQVEGTTPGPVLAAPELSSSGSLSSSPKFLSGESAASAPSSVGTASGPSVGVAIASHLRKSSSSSSLYLRWAPDGPVEDGKDSGIPIVTVAPLPATLCITILGSSKTGKTSLTKQFCSKYYEEDYFPTLEDVYELKRPVLVDGRHVFYNIIDTSGNLMQHEGREKQWLQKRHGFILVFNVNDRASFEKLVLWNQKLLDVYLTDSRKPTILLVGCFADISTSSSRGVTFDEAEAFAHAIGGIGYIEVNNKLYEDAAKCFMELARGIFLEDSRLKERVQDRDWMTDGSSDCCIVCRTAFTMFNRRHHCRRCGVLVCDDCSSYHRIGESIKAKRVCDICLELLPLRFCDP